MSVRCGFARRCELFSFVGATRLRGRCELASLVGANRLCWSVHGDFAGRCGWVSARTRFGCRCARQRSVVAASSVGTWPRVVMDRPELGRHALARLRRVDHATDRRRDGEEWDDVRPRAPPRHTRVGPVRPRGPPLEFVRAALPTSALGAVSIGRGTAAMCGRSPLSTPHGGESPARCRSPASARDRPPASASLMHMRPSVTAITMSWPPRVVRSVKTFIQNVVPSVCAIQTPTMARNPSGRTASASETALLRTTDASRIVTRRASKQPRDTPTRAAGCAPVTSATMASVTTLIRSGETGTACASFKHA
jgi:hypothetical protein